MRPIWMLLAVLFIPCADLSSHALSMPMNYIENDVTKSPTLVAMHRGGRGGSNRNSARSSSRPASRPAYRQTRSASVTRSSATRSVRASRQARQVRAAKPARSVRASRPMRSKRSLRRSHRGVRGYGHNRAWRGYRGRHYWGPSRWWGYGLMFPFGCAFYPGWGWWYYAPYGCSYYSYWGCWHFGTLGYWYYPGLQFGAYIASRPDRIMYVDNDSDDDLYYGVYYRRQIGDVYYLYRVDEPMLIQGRRAVKVQLPKGKDSDYMIVAEKSEDKLPQRMHQDKSGKVIDVGKEDPGYRPSEVQPGLGEKIKVEDLSKKDKRELKKLKRDLKKKDKKLRELGSEIAEVKDPEAEAKEKALKRIEAEKDDQAEVGANGSAMPSLGVDAD